LVFNYFLIGLLIICSSQTLIASTYELILHKSSITHHALITNNPLSGITINKQKAITFPSEKSGINALFSKSKQSSVDIIEVESLLPLSTIQEKLSALPGVDYVEPNYELHLYQEAFDPLSFKQTYLSEGDLYQLWSLEPKQSVLVAVIDTGIDLDHPDLSEHIYTNTLEKNNRKDDDGNGYIDDIHGFAWLRWLDNDLSYDTKDYHGHGTHMAGIIAGIKNNTGIIGIHPKAQILPLKVFDSAGYGTQLEASLAIRYAVAQGAKIINCSWGFEHKTKILEDAIAYAIAKDVIIVAAVGNGGHNTVMYPAKFPEVLGVGSYDASQNKLYEFSNYGKDLDIAISGKHIFSTYLNKGYTYLSGTSASTAIITGVLARIMSYYPYLSASAYQDLLIQSSPKRSEKNINIPNIYSLLAEFESKPKINLSDKLELLSQESSSYVSQVMIAPNPVKSHIAQCYFTATQAGLEGSIQLYSIDGIMQKKVSFITSLNQNKILIPVDSLANGTYIYTLHIGNNKQKVKGKISLLR
jgi:hypothetical protein